MVGRKKTKRANIRRWGEKRGRKPQLEELLPSAGAWSETALRVYLGNVF